MLTADRGQQRFRLGHLPSSDHQCEPLGRQRMCDGTSGTSRPQDARHAKQVPIVQQRAKRLQEPWCIAVGAGQSLGAVCVRCYDIDWADLRGRLLHHLHERYHCLLVRYGDIAAGPIGISRTRGEV